VYRLFESPWFIRGVARLYSLAARRHGATTGRRLADRSLALLRGWPRHIGTPWVNLQVQRLHWRVCQELEPRSAVPVTMRHSPRPDPARIGVLARLDHAFFFTQAFFRSAPDEATVFAFDFGSREATAEASVGEVVESYERFGEHEVAEVARAIERADLDLLLVDVRKTVLDDILDRINTPCVAFFCAEVHLRQHPKISFHLYHLEQADYLVRNNRMYCGTSRSWFSNQLIFPSSFPYSDQGLDSSSLPSWADREPLLFLHGRLRKASLPYLDAVFGLLAADQDLHFMAAGGDASFSLDMFRRTARRYGAEGRFEYLGPYDPLRGEGGSLLDPAWRTVFDTLRRARVAPDPWPLAGGITRLEAFLCGTPVAHMGIDDDPLHWGRPQYMLTADHRALEISGATAFSPEEYVALCRRLLYDETFANEVAAKQLEVATRVTDLNVFWQNLARCYRTWWGGAQERRTFRPRERRSVAASGLGD
jgi:hypothetical protein